jgi:hypothetical protein
MELVRPKKGTVILKEGDDADALYVLVKGKCGVYQAKQSQLGPSASASAHGMKVAVLQDLDIFGESVIESDGKRNATVVIESEMVRILKLNREMLNKFVEAGKLDRDDGGESTLVRARSMKLERMKSNNAMGANRANFSLFNVQPPPPPGHPPPPPGHPLSKKGDGFCTHKDSYPSGRAAGLLDLSTGPRCHHNSENNSEILDAHDDDHDASEENDNHYACLHSLSSPNLR